MTFQRDEMTSDGRRTPFFLVGAQRSGTTMLRLMLNNHPNLTIPFESGFIPAFYRRLAEYGDLRLDTNVERLLRDISSHPKVAKGGLLDDPGAILSHKITSYPELIDAIFSEHARRKAKARWGDKTPGYVTELDVLWLLFPGCRIVHLVRDGRDVALSLRSLSWGTTHIPQAANDWMWKTTLAHKIGAVLGRHYLEVKYEDLVLTPEDVVREICTFLGEPYHKDVLDYASTAREEMPKDSIQWHENSTKAPDPGKVFLWKREMSLADRIIFDQVAGPALDLFGYEREQHPGTLGSRLKNLYYSVKQW